MGFPRAIQSFARLQRFHPDGIDRCHEFLEMLTHHPITRSNRVSIWNLPRHHRRYIARQLQPNAISSDLLRLQRLPSRKDGEGRRKGRGHHRSSKNHAATLQIRRLRLRGLLHQLGRLKSNPYRKSLTMTMKRQLYHHLRYRTLINLRILRCRNSWLMKRYTMTGASHHLRYQEAMSVHQH